MGCRVPNNSAHRLITVVKAYHPVKNEWREVDPEVDPFRKCDSESVNSWKKRNFIWFLSLAYLFRTQTTIPWEICIQIRSLPSAGPCDEYEVVPGATVVPSDALSMNVRWVSKKTRRTSRSLLEGKGFGTDNLEIVWNDKNCSTLWTAKIKKHMVFNYKCPIQLWAVVAIFWVFLPKAKLPFDCPAGRSHRLFRNRLVMTNYQSPDNLLWKVWPWVWPSLTFSGSKGLAIWLPRKIWLTTQTEYNWRWVVD